MKKIFIILLAVITLIIPQLGCKAQINNEGIGKTSFHLDTVCRITIYSMEGAADMDKGEQEKEALLLITDAFKLCDEYEKLLSKTIEGSDIYKINHAGGAAVEVADETAEVIKKGLEFGELSEGTFDITIGKASDLWDFHDEDEEGQKIGTLPDEAGLAEAVKHVDYRNIIIEGNSVRLTDPEVQIDLGGIAKGYIADKVAEYLESKGVTSAVVDLGGNIVVIGAKTETMEGGESKEFSIGIADPISEKGELLGVLPCKDKTVVTSGTYERYFELDGVRYHHVLNPETGYPTDTDLLSVTVIADKGRSVDCDGMSTTCLTLGKEKGLELIRKTDGVEAIMVDKSGEVYFSDDNLNFESN